ncbi:hypothetical protein EDC04DRAFT_2898523 [Pisolithus marmoratus]|nr:hypothetical protein EDC04DRAFT_2898523 [Pisolithus marmoratus]
MVCATPPTAAHICHAYCRYDSQEEESQLLDYHYFLHTPASDDGFPSQGIQHSQGSGGILYRMLLSTRYLLMKKIEQLRVWFETISNKSQTPLTSHWHGTPLIVLLAEDACFEIDIVEEHHHQNHFPCAPDPQCLHNVHQQQLPNCSAPLQQDVLLDEHSPPAVAQQVSAPGELGGPTTKLHPYPYKFYSFPNRAWFIDEKSALYITKAMAEHEQTSMLIPCGYWPDYHKDLGILV